MTNQFYENFKKEHSDWNESKLECFIYLFDQIKAYNSKLSEDKIAQSILEYDKWHEETERWLKLKDRTNSKSATESLGNTNNETFNPDTTFYMNIAKSAFNIGCIIFMLSTGQPLPTLDFFKN